MDAPTRKHKPIVSVSDYDQIDGQYANDTDARALSLGFAQYNKPETPLIEKELSLKVWRMGSNGWSRMSEELPIHRNLDLTKLFLETLIEGYNQQKGNPWENESLTPHDDNGSILDIMDYYERYKHILNPRLKGIKELLNRMDFEDDNIDIEDEDAEEDFYSPTSWEKDPCETEEEYIERIQDQEDWLESFDD